MGPTNVALVKLFQADQDLRQAQGRLDATTRSVRIQQRRVNDLTEKLHAAQAGLRERRSQAAQLELDIKSRDEHIDKLRRQQQEARNQKEYQTFLIEINTAKVDRGKIEDQAMKTLEEVDALQKQVEELNSTLQTERARHQTMKEEIGPRTGELQAEIDRLQPLRDAAADATPPRARDLFERIADRYEGEAMAALGRPNPRREEYVCSACHLSLVADLYNRLHVRDEPVLCPSCGRLLFIPDELPPELAVNKRKAKREPRRSIAAGTGRQTTAADIARSIEIEDEEESPAEAGPDQT